MSELTAFNAYCRANGINANGQLATEDLAPAFSAGYKARQHELRQRVQELTAERDELLAALEELSLYVAYNGDDWVQKKAKAAIASAKEK